MAALRAEEERLLLRVNGFAAKHTEGGKKRSRKLANKEMVCREFASSGTCRWGDSCRFVHPKATSAEEVGSPLWKELHVTTIREELRKEADDRSKLLIVELPRVPAPPDASASSSSSGGAAVDIPLGPLVRPATVIERYYKSLYTPDHGWIGLHSNKLLVAGVAAAHPALVRARRLHAERRSWPCTATATATAAVAPATGAAAIPAVVAGGDGVGAALTAGVGDVPPAASMVAETIAVAPDVAASPPIPVASPACACLRCTPLVRVEFAKALHTLSVSGKRKLFAVQMHATQALGLIALCDGSRWPIVAGARAAVVELNSRLLWPDQKTSIAPMLGAGKVAKTTSTVGIGAGAAEPAVTADGRVSPYINADGSLRWGTPSHLLLEQSEGESSLGVGGTPATHLASSIAHKMPAVDCFRFFRCRSRLPCRPDGADPRDDGSDCGGVAAQGGLRSAVRRPSGYCRSCCISWWRGWCC